MRRLPIRIERFWLPYCALFRDQRFDPPPRQGAPLGNPQIDVARHKAVAEMTAQADQRAANVIPLIREIQKAGATSLRQIADGQSLDGQSDLVGSRWFLENAI